MTNTSVDTAQAPGTPARRRTIFSTGGWGFRYLSRWLSIVLIFLGWLGVSELGLLGKSVMPTPAEVFLAGVELSANGKLLAALAASLLRVAAGASAGILLGIVLGLAAGYAVAAEILLDRPMQMLKAIPFNGVVPILIVTLGIGEGMKITLIAIGAMVPVYLGTFAGVRSVDVKLIELARVYRVPRWRVAYKTLFLGALPSMLNSIRFALAIAWIALVASETVNAQNGLGYLMAQAQRFVRTDQVYLAILIYGVLGIATDRLVTVLEARLLRWKTTFAGN
ncbi:MAG: sulfonate transporter [Pseudomonadota bacterium]|jgi:sulfonate transport system permease protein